ncbi:MAG TPA: FliM/FliN family flagellar motor C-terminal domain-containing protein [Terracidiphilus sp.]|nr:FliM/FliN family flagellar motor C-terminal domain-containing protein [Terracidiphilus sp.]
MQSKPEQVKPAPGGPAQGRTETGKAEAGKTETRLVPAPQPVEEEETSLRAPVTLLPVALDVMIPVRTFRVRHLLALAPGHVIETQWSSGDDMPLGAGNVRLAWSEFEVVDTQLAVRITRLA